MKFLLFTICFTGICIGALAQQPQLLQERLYRNDANFKGINASATTRQGNFLLSGPARSSSGAMDNWFLLVNPDTDTIWTRKGPLLKNGDQGIHQTADNGFIFYSTVYGQSGLQNSADMILQKLDANGNASWTKYINNDDRDAGRTMLLMPDQGYMLAGEQMPIVSKRYMLTRTDAAGNVWWQKDYTTSINEGIVDMKFTQTGNIIMGGYVQVGNNFQLKLVLVNQNGDYLNSSIPIISTTGRSERMAYTYNSITSLSDGGFLVTGTIDTSSFQFVGRQGFVLKVNQNLQKSWSYIRRTNPYADFNFTKTKQLADGTLLALAYHVGTNKFYIHHLSANGNPITIYPFTSTLCSHVRTITFDAITDTTFLIGGYGTSGQNSSFYVAKVKIPGLARVLTVTSTKEETTTATFSLGQSYPNPTAASASIPYTLPQHYTKASILIREIATGREIKRYELKRNSNSLNVDLSQLRNGLYLYSLVVDEQPVAMKKLAVMK